MLTQVDQNWPSVDDPIAAGERVARRLREDPTVRSLFYTVLPVSGQLALGAETLTPDDFDILSRLAALPEARFQRLLKSEERFVREYPDVPIAPAHRERALRRLSRYGIWLACDLIRRGEADHSILAQTFVARSGIAGLRDLIVSHFGNRALLIKLETVLRRLAQACFRERRRLRGADLQAVERIAGRFEELEAQQHAFAELSVLQSYYEGKLGFDADEVRQLLEVTGEGGTSCGERLGLAPAATIPEMLAAATQRQQYWSLRAADVIGGDQPTVRAAGVMARSYEQILYRLLAESQVSVGSSRNRLGQSS